MQHHIQFVTRFDTVSLTPDGAAAAAGRAVPVEAPVALSFFGIGYAVMMATPADLEDFATGFALSERLIGHIGELVRVDVRPADQGLLLDIELAPDRREHVFDRVRVRVGESSCGLCGIENLEQALRPLPRVGCPPAIEAKSLFRALETIRAHQPLNADTGAVHAAAFFDGSGALVAAREDVGRHNALDKLVGHCLRGGVDMSGGFALLTSRCSYELVEKAALAGFPMLVTVSAPTSLAVERAHEAGLTLIALARADSMLVMADPHGLFAAGR
ncbi:formate dehydrogenase accessory sulfurtransferase FdhD [Sphingosinicella terrae]|uniref:formate dehydrogenase accessory sulfurtransferase FdhD n=1 Tax=Sphingosinicella terrae TaxID=2172047 RepID=UPI000E0D478D|nr:formate dehydrogenase accessory sulfurtransferase FdhD [Sphingosinicella terrae]